MERLDTSSSLVLEGELVDVVYILCTYTPKRLSLFIVSPTLIYSDFMLIASSIGATLCVNKRASSWMT